MHGTNRSGYRGRRVCYVTPDLSYDYVGGRENRRAKTINGMGKKKKKKENMYEVPGLSLIHI